MPRLELRHLRLVCAITRHGSLTRAAQELCISQPAVSRQLTELEDAIGLMLFSRTRKAMIPTEAGKEFHVHALVMLDALAVLEEKLRQRSRSGGGTLRLAIDRVHQDHWLPLVIRKFRALHPDVEIAAMQVSDLMDSLLQREIDVAIIGETSAAAGIVFTPLHPDEMLVVMPAGHPLCSRNHVSPTDLQGADVLYCFDFDRSYLRRRYLQPQGIELNSFQHIHSIDAIIRLVEAGEGITILPRALVSEALAAERVTSRPIGESGLAFTWYAATAGDSPKPYLADFVAMLQSDAAASTRPPEALKSASQAAPSPVSARARAARPRPPRTPAGLAAPANDRSA